MGMSRDTALLTGADLVDYTAQTDLANLETDGELDLDALVLEAHREVYDVLRARWTSGELAALTNEEALERAVAWLAMSRLAVHLEDGLEAEERYRARAMEWIDDRFRPEFSDDTNEPRRAGEAIPAVVNVSSRARFRGVS